MSKKLAILSTAVASGALIVGAAIPAAGSSGQAAKDGTSAGVAIAAAGSSSQNGRDRTFSVTATLAEANQLDLGAPGPSLGDEIVFSGPLLQSGQEIGHQGAVCTTVSLQRQEAECIATYSLSGGEITAQDVFILNSAAPYDVAITGGSGYYEGVKGQIHVLPATQTNPNGILTFHLED